MRKVLFILHLPPPVHGASMVGNYIKESEVINNSFNCKFINLGTSHTIYEIGKNPLIKLWRFLFVIYKLIVHVIFFRPELCYLSISAGGAAFIKDYVAVLLLKLFRIKRVYHFHNKGVRLKHDTWFYNLMYHSSFKNAEVIMLSEFLYYDIEKYVPKEKVYFCPNGIPNTINSTDESLVKNTRGDVNILFLSNLIETKGVYTLLEACRLLAERELSFCCFFVGKEGDISEEQFNMKVKDLKLDGYVFYLGGKYGKDKQEMFKRAHIFAFPTFYDKECFPLVLLEAMHYSLPIVSTFEGGIPSIVDDGETGFLVFQKDTKTLALKLEKLIKNPDIRSQMGKLGREKYEDNFSLTVFELRIKEILDDIMIGI